MRLVCFQFHCMMITVSLRRVTFHCHCHIYPLQDDYEIDVLHCIAGRITRRVPRGVVWVHEGIQILPFRNNVGKEHIGDKCHHTISLLIVAMF